MEQNYLATYKDGSNWSFSWFMTEEEAREWIENESGSYEEVEVIEIVTIRKIK
ncbi:hypothetical protein [Anaerovorax sp. IOR16]|uniref:hypothetical protein n=1 Tax=Anaerovorax sp. IOR16 TaxID=2773458 RepID=UPI0019D14410|nr:hypothetical protein [Anaerovorax sp. IOR16]